MSVEKEERIVGIDPGSHHLGFSCITKSGTKLKLLTAETVHAKKTEPLYERLATIRTRLSALLDEFKPEIVALEDVFAAKNMKSAFYLGIARGVVFAACMERGIKVAEYAPTHVKSVVTGNGRADKQQVQKMVGLILGEKIEVGFDASDAIAIAVCHASQSKRMQLLTC